MVSDEELPIGKDATDGMPRRLSEMYVSQMVEKNGGGRSFSMEVPAAKTRPDARPLSRSVSWMDEESAELKHAAEGASPRKRGLTVRIAAASSEVACMEDQLAAAPAKAAVEKTLGDVAGALRADLMRALGKEVSAALAEAKQDLHQLRDEYAHELKKRDAAFADLSSSCQRELEHVAAEVKAISELVAPMRTGCRHISNSRGVANFGARDLGDEEVQQLERRVMDIAGHLQAQCCKLNGLEEKLATEMARLSVECSAGQSRLQKLVADCRMDFDARLCQLARPLGAAHGDTVGCDPEWDAEQMGAIQELVLRERAAREAGQRALQDRLEAVEAQLREELMMETVRRETSEKWLCTFITDGFGSLDRSQGRSAREPEPLPVSADAIWEAMRRAAGATERGEAELGLSSGRSPQSPRCSQELVPLDAPAHMTLIGSPSAGALPGGMTPPVRSPGALTRTLGAASTPRLQSLAAQLPQQFQLHAAPQPYHSLSPLVTAVSVSAATPKQLKRLPAALLLEPPAVLEGARSPGRLRGGASSPGPGPPSWAPAVQLHRAASGQSSVAQSPHAGSPRPSRAEAPSGRAQGPRPG